MLTHTLKSGVKIPGIALGLYHISPQQATSIVSKALDIGYRGFDSAQIYQNEKQSIDGISEWLSKDSQNKREDIFFSTKLFDNVQGYDKTKRSVSRTLDKMKGINSSYIDQVLILSPQTNKEKRLETWKALQDLAKEGSIKSIGVANYGVHHLKELYEWDGLEIEPDVNQVELHPWLRRDELVKFCVEKGIKMEAYSPLAKGQKFENEKLTKLSKKYNKTQAQILIKWSLQMGYIPLPKTSNPERLVSNFDVWDFEIKDEDMEILNMPNSYFVTGWDPTTFHD